MKYYKNYKNYLNESNYLSNQINNNFKEIFGEYEGHEIAGDIIIPNNFYNNLEQSDKDNLNSSVGMAIVFSEDILKSLKTEKEEVKKNFSEPEKKEQGEDNYHFLRWTSSPENDIQRNFSGHMQAWVDSEEEAWNVRKEEEKDGRSFLYEPKYDSFSDMWNYDPEWGISGYYFKDKDSFDEAMDNIKEISWHHKDNNQQELGLFSAKKLGSDEGYDGEELFRDIDFIKYIDEEDSYDDIKKLL